jgi:hypothetical protein
MGCTGHLLQASVQCYWPAMDLNTVGALYAFASTFESTSLACRYNQALWATYDAVKLAPVLAAHSYQGLPLLGQVDPAPVALMGRHIGFKLAGDSVTHVRASHVGAIRIR